ncbi:MAG: SDR family oxidoreductase, partial [Natronomonas sp.]|nr:SDR family oxidoreductase [Natronomonas sp.]
TKGIGRGIAEGLADAGANVVVNARSSEDVRSVAEELDERGTGEVIGVAADVAVPGDIESLVDRAVKAFGEIHLLVNNAAVWPQEESLVEADLEDWNWTMNVNVRAQYYASKLVAAHMIALGSLARRRARRHPAGGCPRIGQTIGGARRPLPLIFKQWPVRWWV